MVTSDCNEIGGKINIIKYIDATKNRTWKEKWTLVTEVELKASSSSAASSPIILVTSISE